MFFFFWLPFFNFGWLSYFFLDSNASEIIDGFFYFYAGLCSEFFGKQMDPLLADSLTLLAGSLILSSIPLDVSFEK